MSRIADLLAAAPAEEPGEAIPLWTVVPDGYAALPLENIEPTLDIAYGLITELAPAELQPSVGPVLNALFGLLTDLSGRNAAFCGLGRHVSAADGELLTSTLVLSAHRTEGQGDPRKLLGEFVERMAGDDWEEAKVDVVDVNGRWILFREAVLDLPAPQLPDAPEQAEDATAPVALIEALVPNEDGSVVAAIELATPFLAHTGEFGPMVAALAMSLSFEEPPAPAPASSITAALG